MAWRVASLALVLAVLAAAPVRSDTCPAADGPVNCEACREGGDINYVSDIPRYNQEGTEVSANLGDYDWVVCDANDECEWWDGDMEDVSNPKSPANYVQGTGAYVALLLVMAPLSVLCMVSVGCLRLCGCCGGWTPTYDHNKKGKKRCCAWCHYHKDHAPLLASEDRFKYPAFSKLCARICMVVFAILIFVFITIGQQMGNVALTDAAKRLANAPDSTVATIRKMTNPVHNLIVGIASNTLVPTVQDINATLLDAVDLDSLINTTDCVADKAKSPPGLSELLGMVDTVLNLKTEVDRIDVDVVSTINSLTELADAMDVQAPALQQLLANLSSSRDAITPALNTMDTQLDIVDATLDPMLDNSTGLPAIVSDLTFIGDTGNFPTEATVDDTANGGAGSQSLQELLTDQSSWVEADYTALGTKLSTLEANMSSIPDTNATANNIDQATALRTSFVEQDVVSTTNAVLANMTEELKRVPGSAAADEPLDNMLAAINGVNASKLDQLVVDLNNTVNTVPDPVRFGELVDEVFAIADIIPCIDGMTPIVERVNETLVSLPDFVNEILNISGSVKGQIDSARELADDAEEGIRLVQNNSDSIDFSGLTSVTDELRRVQNSSTTQFEQVRQYTNELDSAGNISFSGIEDSLATVQNEMNSSSLDPDPTLLDQLRSFGSNQTTVQQLLAETKASLAEFAQFRCINTASPCTTSADCGGFQCSYARKQCSATSSSAGTTCTGTTGGECPGGYCLFEAIKYAALRQALNEYSVPSFATASLETSMNSLLANVRDVDLATPRSEVDSVRQNLLNVPIESSNATLNDALAQGKRVREDTEATNTTWAEVQAATRDVPDPSGVQEQLQLLNDTVKDLDDIGDKTRTFVNVLNASREFLYDTLPVVFDGISEAELDAAFDADGLVGTYNKVMEAARSIVRFMETQQESVDEVSGSTPSNSTLEADLDNLDDDVLPRLRVLSEDKYFDNGPYYFVASLMEYDTIQPNDPLAFRVFRDSNGDKYGNDELCLTTTCINNEVDFVNREPLSDVFESFELDVPGSSSISLTRETATGVPFIVPALIALLGLLAAVLCCPKKSKCQRVPLCISGCCLFFCIPLTFLFSGLPLILVIAGGDVCRGGANVGYHVLSKPTYVADACDAFGAEVSLTSPTACNISLGMDTYSQLELPQLVEQLFGTCTGATAVWNNVLLDLQDAIVDIPSEEVNKTLADMTTGDFVPRQRIRDDLVRGAQRMGQTGRIFVGDVNGVLTCEEVNGDVVEFKEAVCCDVMSAFYWSITAWNVIAWLMFCLGCPACWLGWKRFPARPSGKHYRELVGRDDRARAQRKMEDEAILAGAGGGGGALQMVNVDMSNQVRMDNPMRSQQPPRAATSVPAPVTSTLPAGVTTPAAWGSNANPNGKGYGHANHKGVMP